MIPTRIDFSLVLAHGSAPLASPASSLATKCEADLASFVQSALSGRAPCSSIFSFRICSARNVRRCIGALTANTYDACDGEV